MGKDSIENKVRNPCKYTVSLSTHTHTQTHTHSPREKETCVLLLNFYRKKNVKRDTAVGEQKWKHLAFNHDSTD